MREPKRSDDDPQAAKTKSYLTAKQLRGRYGNRSHMWIERRLTEDPNFPRPVYFGRFRFWALDEIEQWERAAIVARDRTPPEAA
jgi:predicted DNA-binding transcriptional regulator AlpA